jgi:hypothetical protein
MSELFDTTRRYPRSTAQAFADVRAGWLELPERKPRITRSFLVTVWLIGLLLIVIANLEPLK